jgi:hypothetical protein
MKQIFYNEISILKLLFHYSHMLRYPILNISWNNKFFNNLEIFVENQNIFKTIYEITPTEKKCKSLFGYFGLNSVNLSNYLGLNVETVYIKNSQNNNTVIRK